MQPPKDITQLLISYGNGDKDALDQLMPAVYDELRRVAQRALRSERSDHTLQATALVNEAYLRMVNQDDVTWQNRAQFFGFASHVMRNILVDHARRKRREKRGGGAEKVEYDDALHIAGEQDLNVIALDDALCALAKTSERKVKVVELRYFGGLSIEETAEVMGISIATVNREWVVAKAWLHREIQRGDPA